MTESEAIKWQEAFKKTYKGFQNDVDDACDMAINALEKLEKIKKVLDTTCLSDDVSKCYYDGDCMLHEYEEIVKIVRGDEE